MKKDKEIILLIMLYGTLIVGLLGMILHRMTEIVSIIK